MNTIAPTTPTFDGSTLSHQNAASPGQPSDATPPPAGVWDAMRRHRWLVILPTVLLVTIAVGLGFVRSPRYTAETRLIVGRLNIGNPGLAGFVTATQALASAYSRAITATGVVDPVARRLHMTPSAVSSQITSTPIQNSPVFRVIATAKSQALAIALANDASEALTSYISTLGLNNPDSTRLLGEYGQVSHAFNQANARFQDAENRYRHSSTKANAAQLSSATTARASAQLQLQTIASSYQASAAGQGSTSLVETMNTATSTTSDRGSVIQMLAFVAAVVGLALGAALANARAKRNLSPAAG
jgi:hypothetical protein